MGFFDFFKRKKYRVTLHSVSRKLKLSQDSIVSILRDAGFEIFNIPVTILNEKHLAVLSVYYVEAIKNYYNTSLKKYNELGPVEQEELRIFFSSFILESDQPYVFGRAEDNVFKKNLSVYLIEVFFYKKIDEIVYEQYNDLFGQRLFGDEFEVNELSSVDRIINKYIHKIKLKIKKSFANVKSRLIQILISSHYYIFSNDEEHSREANFTLCFSAIKKMGGEALININYLKFRKWKKILKYS